MALGTRKSTAPEAGISRGGSDAGPPAIRVEGVNKTFRIPDHRYTSLKERVLRGKLGTERTLQALRDVSFEVGRGEFFGILGHNGSGKSTLLKTLAGILQVDGGTIDTRGTISPMLALGIGFHPELAAKDNVLINGALMGIGRKEMLRRFPAILEFAELEEFEELPLKNYSSGMMLRLAFAAGINVDAEIILLDEILAVGDMTFQEKCFETFHSMRRDGKTILLVSHGLGIIQQYCDRAMLLDHGEVVSIGDPEEVVNDYTTTATEEIVEHGPSTSERWGDGTAEILEVWFEDNSGKETKRFDRGQEITVRVRARFNETLADAYIGFGIRDHVNQLLFDVSRPAAANGTVASGTEKVFSATFEGWLNPGHYSVWPIISRVGDVPQLSDLRADYVRFMVEGDTEGTGPMYPPTRTSVEGG